MALNLVTGPTTEPLTLPQAKSQLRLEVDADDALIASYITVARQWVEAQLRRALHPQTYDLSIDWDWPVRRNMHYIRMPLEPLISVTSITYVDADGASQTLATSEYTVVARDYSSYIVPAYDVTWPDVRCVPEAITIRIVVGAESKVPEPVVQAMLLLVSHWYENRVPVVPKEMLEVPLGVEALISPYRKGL